MIYSKTFTEPTFNEKEILRYAGCKTENPEIIQLLKDSIKEIRPLLSYKVCYGQFQVQITDDCCDFGSFSFRSKNLAKNLSGCNSAVIFAATVGIEADRIISKYTRLSPSKAMMLHAIGSERVEALCDVFCEDIRLQYNSETKPRFSPGYGDLSLEYQKEIFSVLSPEKNIGLFLNDNLLMIPSKSVTAIVGLK